MMNAEPEHTITLRDVGEDDLEDVLRLNEASVPAVNSVDLEQMRWFAANAAYFRVAILGDV
jgi:predicted GNAT superfamily acetyltransferase